jgi:hypothetical protein
MVMGIHVIAKAIFFRQKQSPTRNVDCSPALAPSASVVAKSTPALAGGARESAPRNDIILLIILWFLISSCSTSTPPPTLQIVSVYSSSFTQPWLTELYDCATESSAVIRLSDSAPASAAEIRLQIGEPEVLSGFAYQIDEEEILIVTNRVSPIQNLTLDQAQALFMGLGDAQASVQVWVYDSDADVQRVFDQLVMKGRSVTSSARVAVNPQQMSDTLVNESNTVGILPRHWQVGDTREVFSVATVPVLALTKAEPQGAIKALISCLQK